MITSNIETTIKRCFVISPIGKEDSDIRKNSDLLFKHILKPVVKDELGYEISRGDLIREPGIVNNQVLRSLLDSELVIADLTNKNGNVFYELAVRHITGKPFIHMMEEKQDKPFDLSSTRIIRFKLDLEGAEKAKDELLAYIRSTEKENFIPENPLTPIFEEIGFMPGRRLLEDKVSLDPTVKKEINDLIANAMEKVSSQISEQVKSQLGATNRIDPSKEVKLPEETRSNVKALDIVEKNLKSIKEAVSTEPSKFDVESALAKANVLYYDKRYSDAVIEYDKILRHDERNTDALINKGYSLMMLGKHKEALNVVEKIYLTDKGNIDAMDLEASVLLFLGKYKESLTIIEEILKKDPSSSHALINKGITLANLSRYEEAIPILEQFKEDEPLNLPVLERLALSYGETGRHEKQNEIYKKILDVSPADQIDWNNRGNVLYLMEKYKEALEAYNMVLEIDSQYIHGWNNKGLTLGQLKKHKEAIEAYDRALEINPSFGDVWVNKGVSLEALKKYKEALDAYNKALEIDPADKIAQANRSEVQIRIKESKNS